MAVSFQDVRSELLDQTTPAGIKAYAAWRSDPSRAEVVRFVENFTHDSLFKVSSADVLRVIDSTGHALGDVASEEQCKFMEDFTCPFAFQHLFHDLLETSGKVPSWQECVAYMNGSARSRWVAPLMRFLSSSPDAQDYLKRFDSEESGKTAILRAVKWRVGKFYLSALRELDLLVRLREANIPVRYHVLADVLLRVDAWIGKVLLCLYVRNPTYRDGRQGRKPTARRFFPPEFRVEECYIEHQGQGVVWRVSDAEVGRIVELTSKQGG